MKIYEFICHYFTVYSEELIFSQEKLPLSQNSDMVRIFKNNGKIELLLDYNDGALSTYYNPAFEFFYLDSTNLRLDFYFKQDDFIHYKNPIQLLSIYLNNTPLLYQVQVYFMPNKMIEYDEWGF